MANMLKTPKAVKRGMVQRASNSEVARVAFMSM